MKVNGNLTLPTGGLGQIENLVVEKVATLPGYFASEAGRMVHHTTEGVLYINNGTAWVALATGGDATALQNEVNAIEESLGSTMVDANGVFITATFEAYANVTGATDLEGVLSQLDDAIVASDELSELTDVAITTAAQDDFLMYNGSSNKWEDRTAAQVVATLGLVIGTNVQAWDAELDGLAGLASTGIVVHTGAGAFAERTIVQSTTTALTITNGNGVTANPSIAIEAGLDSIAALTVANGHIIYATAVDTFASAAPGSVSGVQAFDAVLDDISALAVIGADQLMYGNGEGTLAYSTITSFGRSLIDDADEATARTTLGLAAGGAGDIWVEKNGDAMTGDLVMATNFVTSSGVPTSDTHLVNKLYVDALLAGLAWKNPVIALLDSNTALTTGVAVIDGVTLVDGDRVLLNGQTLPAENGIYIFTLTGTIFTRATDADSAVELNSAAVFVEKGTVYADFGFTQTEAVVVLGADTIKFIQFNGAVNISAGTGLKKTGNTLDINMGAGIAQLPTDEVGIDLYSPAGGALILTIDGTVDTTATGAQLFLQLDSTTLVQGADGLKVGADAITKLEINADIAGLGLSQAGTGEFDVNVDGSSIEINVDTLRVKAAGITNTMLANSVFTILDDAAATDTIALGETLSILGDGAIDTAILSNVLTVSVKDASTTVKGVASFDTSHFTVTAGAVSLSATLGDISGVTTSTAAGEVLVATGADAFAAKKIHHVEVSAIGTTHIVTHGLAQKFCNVTIVDTITDEVIIPEKIKFDTATQLTVTLNSNLAITIIITGV